MVSPLANFGTVVITRAIFHEPGACLVLVGAGLVLGALGLGLALDFRGMATWHVEMTFRAMAPVEKGMRRVPPWKQMLRKPLEERQRTQLVLERFGGAAFALVGGGLGVTGVVGLVGGVVTGAML